MNEYNTPFSKYSILAAYSLYFSKDKRSYALVFGRLAAIHNTEGSTLEDIAKDTKKMIGLISSHVISNPDLKVKGDNKYIRRLRKELRAAETYYKNAETAGGQLTIQLAKEKVDKTKELIRMAQNNS